jgi:dTDP-4-dehydrorhamnose reductase
MIIVFGASGLLGSTICNLLKLKKKEYIGFSKSKSGFKKINLLNKKDIIKIFKKNNPSIIINCTGLTDVDECNRNIKKAYIENCLIVKNIVESLNYTKKKTHLIHISTDQIYNSPNILKSNPESSKNLNNVYSITKYIGEKNIENYKNSLIIRTNFFGKSISKYKKSYSDFIIKNLKNKKEIRLPENVIFNPVDINFLASKILKLGDLKVKGIYNLGSKDSISKYNFGILIAQKFNLEKKYIKKFKSNYKINRRPLGTYMSTKKISKYFKLPLIKHFINSMKI